MDFPNLEAAFSELEAQDIQTVVISSPRLASSEYKKIRVDRLESSFQASSYTDTQVFHQEIPIDDVKNFCLSNSGKEYRQINIWLQNNQQIHLMISKKGKVHWTEKEPAKAKNLPTPRSHNRKKNYLIEEGMIVPPLVDMGVISEDGKVIQSKYDKFKQINRFLELIDDAFKNYKSEKPLRIIDFGCGKAYLTFILYYYFRELREIPVEIVGLDLKEDVIRKCNLAARKYGYEHLHFELGDIAGYTPSFEVDVVVTLHACDTATDYALYNAVKWQTKTIFSVPCCQHEINKTIQAKELRLLTRYGIIKERISALMTDALRANILQYHGYDTQVLEYIDLEHTPKNIMIRASKRDLAPATLARRREKFLSEIESVINEFQVKPTLYKLLIEQAPSEV